MPDQAGIESVTYLLQRDIVSDLSILTDLAKKRRRSRLTRLLARFRLPNVNLVHGPNYFLPEWAPRGIITVHDLSVFRYPETHPAARVIDFERRFSSSLERSDHLITDSETIRHEVVEFTGFPPDKVTAVPLGIAAEFRPRSLEEIDAVLHRLGLPSSGYGLTVSSLEPRKRIGPLLKAWRLLPSTVRDRFPLVIAGGTGWRNEGLLEEIGVGAAEGWVIPLSFVSDEDLPAVYAGASLFAYPSKYEGFGLPPLEAMASGVPTIVAKGTCLEEVTAGAAMFADPEDEQGFAQLLLQSLHDDAWRSKAVSVGIQVARGYSWERCVDQTIAVYQRVMAERRSY